ncbi:beta-propeller domain-containing protein [Qiania dongpingensis]|uniref:Beta-propeller domain-containing protein n=1 Tax=Qiania dongpingensis TaxID=2763669 RepID=A0A7G9G5M5_9FIRM|nr:beta-propeller domain-containing protein [Qiania dongpingensis]QNM06107.1 beta-propeller domain-containing protein [Qiania dongpingensis]
MNERWEKDPMDQKWIEEAKKTTDMVEPPERLSPDKVTEKLKWEGRKPKRMITGYKAAAAVLLFLILGGSFWLFRQIGRDNASVPDTRTKGRSGFQAGEEPAEGVSLKGGYKTASSYGEIYEYLKKQQENQTETYAGEAADGAMPETAAASENGVKTEDEATPAEAEHSETNIQVEGVDESDIVKTDGKYLYVVYTGEDAVGTVHIIEANGGEMMEVSRTGPVTDGVYRDYDSVLEIYVDGDTMAVLMDCYNEAGENYTVTAVYDITDRGNPKLAGMLSQDGSYHSSRKNGSYIYVFTEKYAAVGSKKNDRTYIPYVDNEPVAYDHIHYPENVAASCSLVAASLDITAPDRFCDTEAVYFSGDTMYVSGDAIYVAEQLWSSGSSKSQTEILKLSYKDGQMEVSANKRFLGRLNDQFSLDQYQGHLRLVATVDDYQNGGETNSLYVMDENLDIVGSIHNLAPGEQIYSARFMGDTGYFVTFRQMDPLFSVDLSDPENPKIMGELKITGFSSYLHFYESDKLLGIGREVNPRTGAFEGIKLSMFDIGDPYDVKELDKTVLEDADGTAVLNNHKAALIDVSKNLLGFCVTESVERKDGGWTEISRYVVYSYEAGSGFTERFSIELCGEDQGYRYYDTRGLYIANTLYLANAGPSVSAYSLESGEKLGEVFLEGEQ